MLHPDVMGERRLEIWKEASATVRRLYKKPQVPGF